MRGKRAEVGGITGVSTRSQSSGHHSSTTLDSRAPMGPTRTHRSCSLQVVAKETCGEAARETGAPKGGVLRQDAPSACFHVAKEARPQGVRRPRPDGTASPPPLPTSHKPWKPHTQKYTFAWVGAGRTGLGAAPGEASDAIGWGHLGERGKPQKKQGLCFPTGLPRGGQPSRVTTFPEHMQPATSMFSSSIVAQVPRGRPSSPRVRPRGGDHNTCAPTFSP
jgi:hypothetical protein